MDLTVIAIVLGLLAIVYGFVTSRQVLGSSAGSEKMQEIAAPLGLSPLVFGLIFGGAWGLYAQVKGRWI